MSDVGGLRKHETTLHTAEKNGLRRTVAAGFPLGKQTRVVRALHWDRELSYQSNLIYSVDSAFLKKRPNLTRSVSEFDVCH